MCFWSIPDSLPQMLCTELELKVCMLPYRTSPEVHPHSETFSMSHANELRKQTVKNICRCQLLSHTDDTLMCADARVTGWINTCAQAQTHVWTGRSANWPKYGAAGLLDSGWGLCLMLSRVTLFFFMACNNSSTLSLSETQEGKEKETDRH